MFRAFRVNCRCGLIFVFIVRRVSSALSRCSCHSSFSLDVKLHRTLYHSAHAASEVVVVLVPGVALTLSQLHSPENKTHSCSGKLRPPEHKQPPLAVSLTLLL